MRSEDLECRCGGPLFVLGDVQPLTDAPTPPLKANVMSSYLVCGWCLALRPGKTMELLAAHFGDGDRAIEARAFEHEWMNCRRRVRATREKYTRAMGGRW